MFVLDVTSRPQPNEILNGFRDMMAGNREVDDRTYRRMMENRVLSQAEQRRQDQLTQNQALMDFYRQQASPERQKELLRLQTDAEKERVKWQLELDQKERDRVNGENPFGKFGLSYGDLVDAEVEDESNRMTYEAAQESARRAQGLFAELNKGGRYDEKVAVYREQLKQATLPEQKALIQSKINGLAALAQDYNDSLNSLKRSGLKVLNDGAKITVVPPPSRFGAYKKIIPNFDLAYNSNRYGTSASPLGPFQEELGPPPPPTVPQALQSAPASPEPIEWMSQDEVVQPKARSVPTVLSEMRADPQVQPSGPPTLDEAWPVNPRQSFFDEARNRLSDRTLSIGEKQAASKLYKESAGRALGYNPIEKGSSTFWKSPGDRFAEDPYGEDQLSQLPSDQRNEMYVEMLKELRARKRTPSTFLGIPWGR